MKYYVIEITTYNNGTADSKGIYEYESKQDAIATFHSKMGSAMKTATYATELLLVISEEGSTVRMERFERPVEEEETEETTGETTEETTEG